MVVIPLPFLATLSPALVRLLKHWRWIGVGILAVALAIQSWRLDREQKAHKRTWEAYAAYKIEIINRTDLTRQAHEAEKAHIEAEYRRDATEADQNYRALAERYRAARLRLTAGGQGAAGKADLSEAGDPGVPEAAASGGVGAEVTIPAKDFDDMAAATAYAVAAHEWLRNSVGDGSE